ncbi:MAG: DUF4091 domain-containing protein [Prevotella sp.]|nr:DUF4091 domain-containing protein [Prevotella sp.]
MMKRRFFSVITLSLFAVFGLAQRSAASDYTEADDGVRPDAEKWGQLENRLYASWASRDVHYVKTAVPQLKMKSDTVVYAWRGERVGVEAVLFSPIATEKLSLRLSEWKKGSVTIPAQQATARFLRYVLTDGFRSCGAHPDNLKPYLVPDVIDLENALPVEAMTTRPVWVTLEVPRDAEAGEYTLTLDVQNAENQEVVERLNLRVNIQDRTLPTPENQAFHLDFWQQPYSVSRYEGVERWSDRHFELLRPYMELLARAGQSVVSAILFYEPWGDQSHDKFSPMVQTTKKRDGSWAYDYTIFDRWVEFMASCGISKQIDCYSMIPWDMSFRYFDEAQGKDVDLKTTTSSAEYKALWQAFLTSFADHLKEKGWFEKTLIAMDERGLENMLEAYAIVQETVPDMKMALAGNYHSELTGKLADYCIAFGQSFSASELRTRRAKGWYSTFYTCCTEKQPNIFTNSQPAEAAYLPIFGIANDFDGYLHWSWLNWPDNPLTDSRFRLFSPGDTYVVCPGPRSSVRWERFIEGVEQAEKIRILREEYKENGDNAALTKLNAAVREFKSGVLTYMSPASKLVNYLESVLNDAPEPVIDVFDYCEVMLEENKRDIAIEKRWLTSVTTTGCQQNLEYTATSPSLTGYVVVNTPIVVERGKTFRLQTVATQNDDDLRWCRVGIFADWSCDSIFDTTANEKVAEYGNKEAENKALLNRTYTIRVPATATLGDSRLRICYSDAWADAPQPCGELTKGFAMDIPMKIVDGSAKVEAEQQPFAKWSGDTLSLSRPGRLFVYSSSGALMDQTPLTTTYSVSDYLRGTYVILVVEPNGLRNQVKFVK